MYLFIGAAIVLIVCIIVVPYLVKRDKMVKAMRKWVGKTRGEDYKIGRYFIFYSRHQIEVTLLPEGYKEIYKLTVTENRKEVKDTELLQQTTELKVA